MYSCICFLYFHLGKNAAVLVSKKLCQKKNQILLSIDINLKDFYLMTPDK